MRAGSALAVAVAGVLLAAGVATAGPAAVSPVVEVSASGTGYGKAITVRVRTPAARPVRRATVLAAATMRAPGHLMSVAPVRLVERSPGLYRGTVRFIMLGQWTVRVDVSGGSIRAATSRLTIKL